MFKAYGVNKKALLFDTDNFTRQRLLFPPRGRLRAGLYYSGLVFLLCVGGQLFMSVSRARFIGFSRVRRSRAAEIQFILNSVINLILSCCFPFCAKVLWRKNKKKDTHIFACPCRLSLFYHYCDLCVFLISYHTFQPLGVNISWKVRTAYLSVKLAI